MAIDHQKDLILTMIESYEVSIAPPRLFDTWKFNIVEHCQKNVVTRKISSPNLYQRRAPRKTLIREQKIPLLRIFAILQKNLQKPSLAITDS